MLEEEENVRRGRKCQEKKKMSGEKENVRRRRKC